MKKQTNIMEINTKNRVSYDYSSDQEGNMINCSSRRTNTDYLTFHSIRNKYCSMISMLVQS